VVLVVLGLLQMVLTVTQELLGQILRSVPYLFVPLVEAVLAAKVQLLHSLQRGQLGQLVPLVLQHLFPVDGQVLLVGLDVPQLQVTLVQVPLPLPLCRVVVAVVLAE
jgi:hypothetical protein